MVMEESAMHHHHESHSPSGGDAPNQNSNSNVYLVGLEFVRQYYTVLNQGPLYLHRFYSDDSSFVHGVSARDSKVAYGQQEIHKRIQSLNFHNCHAKIRQVDSHETLGNGVVIQVTGELSNNGQPMRRFMQTFVLAPQSPKRYYVRNDIFHYQDEVFCDDEGEDTTAESAIDTEEADENEEPVDMNLNGGSDIIPTELPVEVSVSVKMSPSSNRSAGSKAEQMEEDSGEADAEVGVVTVSAQPGLATTNTKSPSAPSAAPVHDEDPVVSNSVAPVPNAPKTFANLFKVPAMNNKQPPTGTKFQSAGPPMVNKGSNGPRAGSPGNHFSVNTHEHSATSPPQVSPQPGSAAAGGAKGLPPRNPRGGGGYMGRDNRDSRDRDNNRPPMDRDSKERRERLTSRSSTTLNDETGSIDGDRRRPVHTYPDANQLFVGNLPHFVTIQDMKDIFQQFGDVAEVKIQKPTAKSGGMKVPYFCFVVFEEASSAQAAIDKKSEIFMKMNGGGQRRLNVEQKRSQRQGRMGDDDGPYNRMDAASPAGGRSSDGPRGSRTFRGSNRGGGPGGDRNDNRDRDGGGGRGHMGGGRGGGGGGGMNSGGGGGRGGGGGSGRGGGGNKP